MIEVVFVQGDDRYVEQVDGAMATRGRWDAVLLRPAVDRLSRATWGGRPVLHRGRLTTIREGNDGRYHWKTYGSHRGGNRYHEAATLNEAQERIQRWAQRRFRFAEEVQT